MGGGKKEERDGESERKDGRKRKTEVKGEGRGKILKEGDKME